MARALDHARSSMRGGAFPVDGRLERPDLLVIGATGRNCGKTELTCRLVARHGTSTPVVGLKVTTVDRTDGHCSRGGAGCGVCSSLRQPWVISREQDCSSPKDTCRLLASGARQVYWMRVLRSELSGGASDLMACVPSGAVGVCESTSLPEVVEPGLFLLVRSAQSVSTKPSARAVAHLADHVVVSDGRSFDLDLDRISVVGGQWALRRDASALVLGGAEGGPEAERDADARTTRASLEPQFDQVVVAFGTGARSTPSVSTGRHGSPEEWCLVTPSLAGGVPPAVVNALFRRRAGSDVVVAVLRSRGRDVCLALCRRRLLAEVVPTLDRGVGALGALGDRYAVRELPMATGSRAGLGSTRQRRSEWRPRVR